MGKVLNISRPNKSTSQVASSNLWFDTPKGDVYAFAQQQGSSLKLPAVLNSPGYQYQTRAGILFLCVSSFIPLIQFSITHWKFPCAHTTCGESISFFPNSPALFPAGGSKTGNLTTKRRQKKWGCLEQKEVSRYLSEFLAGRVLR